MIPLTMGQLLTGYFLFIFIILTYLWYKLDRQLSKNVAEWLTGKNRLFLCNKCHLTFLGESGETVTRCPRCNEMCFLRKRKRF